MPIQSNDASSENKRGEREYIDSFERLRRKNNQKRIGRVFFYIFLAFVLFAILMIAAMFVFFNVKDVKVNSSGLYSDDELRAASGIEEGQNLFSLKEDEVSENIRAAFPLVRSVTISRNLPTTVVIHVKNDEPAYYTEIGGEYFLISDKLRVLEISPDDVTLTQKYSDIKKIKLAPVSRAVVGEKIVFKSKNYSESLEEFLSVVSENALYPSLTLLDATSRFNISVVYEHRLKALLGSVSNMQVKLMFFGGIIGDLGDSSGTVDIKDAEVGYVTLSSDVEFD